MHNIAMRTVVTLVGFLSAAAAGLSLAAPSAEGTAGSGLLWERSTIEDVPGYRLYDFRARGTPSLQLRNGTSSFAGRFASPLGRSVSELSTSWQRVRAGLLIAQSSSWQDDPFRILPAGVDSTSLGLRGAYRFAANWDVTGAYLGTYTDSLPTDGSQRRMSVRTQGLSLGLEKSETWRRGDRLALSLAQPDRARAGTRESRPDGLDAVDLERANTFKLPTREWTTTLNYFALLSQYSGLGLTLVNRSRLTTDTNLSDERIMSIRFSTRF